VLASTALASQPAGTCACITSSCHHHLYSPKLLHAPPLDPPPPTHTHRFCRLDSPDDTLTNIRCDQTSYLAATSFTFSDTEGMTYLDQPILKGAGSTPLYLGASNTAGAKLHFGVAPIVNGSYITIATAEGTCVIDNSTSPLTCSPGGTGSSQSEKYVAVGNASLIRYGMPMFLASVQTGLFCRQVSSSLVCDVTGTAMATALSYMGSSFMVGDEFVITSTPLVISPSECPALTCPALQWPGLPWPAHGPHGAGLPLLHALWYPLMLQPAGQCLGTDCKALPATWCTRCCTAAEPAPPPARAHQTPEACPLPCITRNDIR
jgi:hypothetical protein